MIQIPFASVLALAMLAAPAFGDPVLDAIQEYSEFATYDASIILPEQISEEIFFDVTFIDTRTAEEHNNSTSPSATHIEWREVFGRIDEVPTEGKVILFSNIGVLTVQAAFGLRVLGHDNLLEWKTDITVGTRIPHKGLTARSSALSC